MITVVYVCTFEYFNRHCRYCRKLVKEWGISSSEIFSGVKSGYTNVMLTRSRPRSSPSHWRGDARAGLNCNKFIYTGAGPGQVRGQGQENCVKRWRTESGKDSGLLPRLLAPAAANMDWEFAEIFQGWSLIECAHSDILWRYLSRYTETIQWGISFSKNLIKRKIHLETCATNS